MTDPTQPRTTSPGPDRAEPPRTWTANRIRGLGPVTTVPVAAAIFGLSRSVAYDLIRTGQFPVPVLRFGHRIRIPVPAILAALHLPISDPANDLINRADPSVDRPDVIRCPTRAAPDT